MSPTHFLCLPLITPTSIPQLTHSLRHLRLQTQPKNPDPIPPTPDQIPESAYRPLGVLHLTLGVMNLLDKDGSRTRLDAALSLLQSIDLQALLEWAGNRPRPRPGPSDSGPGSPSNLDKTTTTEPLTISLTGLQPFPNASAATVLSATPADPTSRLFYFSHALRQLFIDAGFVEPEERGFVLHATLINTVYAKSPSERKGEKGRGRGRVSLDARELCRRFNEEGGVDWRKEGRRGEGRFVWAHGVVVGSVRVCNMGARKVAGEGEVKLGMEYKVVGEKRILNGWTEEEGQRDRGGT